MSLTVLGISVYPYGICCALGALAILLGLCRSYRNNEMAARFTIILMLCGGIGARLLYVLLHLNDYIESYGNLWLIFRFFDGGFSMTGLILGLLGACLWQKKLTGETLGKTIDRVALPLPLTIALLRAGESFTELGIGKAVRPNGITEGLPWLFIQSRMGKAVEYRMNVRLFEVFAAVVIFIILLCCVKKLEAHEGFTATLFFILYGGTQMFLESLRDDGHMTIIFLRIAQLGAAFMLIGAYVVMCRKACKAGNLGLYGSLLRGAVMLLGIGLAVAVEFSLDGRLTVGKPTALRDYLVLAAVCVALMMMALRTLLDARQMRYKVEEAV